MKLFNFFNDKTKEPIDNITKKEDVAQLKLTTPKPKDFIIEKDNLEDSFDKAYNTALRENLTIQVNRSLRDFIYGEEQRDIQFKAYQYFKQLKDNDERECAKNPSLKPRSDRVLMTIVECEYDKFIANYEHDYYNRDFTVTDRTFTLPINIEMITRTIVNELMNDK